MTDSENAVTDSKYNAGLSMVIMLRYSLDPLVNHVISMSKSILVVLFSKSLKMISLGEFCQFCPWGFKCQSQ